MRTAMLFTLVLAACDDSGVIGLDDPITDDVTDTDVTTETDPGSETDDTTDVTETDDTTDTEDTEDTEPLVTPTPSPACGNDVDIFNGEVRPDLGTLPAASAFTGNPANNGAFGRFGRKGNVPNPTQGRDSIAVTTYAPSLDGSTVAPGRFPLVVLMPGFTIDPDQYAHFYLPMATHGFIVVTIAFPNTGFLEPAAHDKNALEAKAVIDWALQTGPFKDSIDGTKIAAVGHSQGGKIAFYAASIDPRIDLVVGWDPQNGGGPPCALGGIGGDCNAFPVAPNCDSGESGIEHLMQAESLTFAAEDRFTTPDEHLRAIQFYRGAPSPAHLVYMPGARHASWTDKNSDASRISKYVTNALLLARLQNKTGLADYLPGGSKLDGERTVTRHASK